MWDPYRIRVRTMVDDSDVKVLMGGSLVVLWLLPGVRLQQRVHTEQSAGDGIRAVG